MIFSFNQLSEPLVSAINTLGYQTPTEIQSKAIPLLLNGEIDFVGQAQTGTGKTAAFCLPLLEKIDATAKGIQAIILSPTRELANQINEEIKRFSQFTEIQTATVYGGVGYRNQIDELKKAHIVIATPGRAIDLLERGRMVLDQAKFLIIDEADEMLKMGFIEDVELILGNVGPDACKWMFSATMPAPIIKLMEEKLNSPQVVRVTKKTMTNENVSQSYIYLKKKDYIKALKAIIFSDREFYGIVFCETREETKTLGERLSNLGQRIVTLHGDLNQRQRDDSMALFKSRKAKILVCTDVAARGLDISEVSHVINLGLPRKLDSYVHRIGRTGRAGHLGQAISFVAPGDRSKLRTLERMVNQKIPKFELPTNKAIKSNLIKSEIAKMEGIKSSIKEKRDEFKVDKSFGHFQEFCNDLSKEELSKLLFSYQFNRELRMVDESLQNLNLSVSVPSVSEDRPRRGRRDGRRSRSGRSEGRREGRREGRSEGRREGRSQGRREGRTAGRSEARSSGRSEGRSAGQRSQRSRHS